MNIWRQVGRNVKRIRKVRGWSQEELAFESDLHRTYISGIERGARNPRDRVEPGCSAVQLMMDDYGDLRARIRQLRGAP